MLRSLQNHTVNQHSFSWKRFGRVGLFRSNVTFKVCFPISVLPYQTISLALFRAGSLEDMYSSSAHASPHRAMSTLVIFRGEVSWQMRTCDYGDLRYASKLAKFVEFVLRRFFCRGTSRNSWATFRPEPILRPCKWGYVYMTSFNPCWGHIKAITRLHDNPGWNSWKCM